MKYAVEVEIDAPRSKVIELFDNPVNMSKWQPELIDFQHESGVPGQVGAKSILKYDMGKRKVEMIETITSRNLPDEFSSTYESKGVWNKVVNHFIDLGSGRTKWKSENEFKFSGLFKLMAIFMAGTFKKQTLKYMKQFKEFLENEYNKK